MKSTYNPYKHLLPIRCDKSGPRELPQRQASLISFMTNHWLTSFMWKAYRKGITAADLYDVPPEDCAQLSGDRFELVWKNEVKSKGADKASLSRILLKLSTKSLLASTLCILLFNTCSIISPIYFVHRILDYATASERPSVAYGLSLVFGMASIEACRSMLLTTAWAINTISATRARSAVLTGLYRKITRLQSLKDSSPGELINLCSNDGQRVFELMVSGNYMLGCVIAIVAAFFSIPLVGAWGLLGFVSYFSFLPAQVLMSRAVAKIRGKTVVHTDARVKLLTEILTCIKLIKMYAWEKSFSSKISEIRGNEKKGNEDFILVNSVIMSVPSFMPLLASVVTFLSVTLSGNPLTATQAFTFVSLLNSIRLTLTITPVSAKAIAEGLVALKRIKAVLLMEEKRMVTSSMHEKGNAVEISSGYFAWETSAADADHKTKAVASSTKLGESARLMADTSAMEEGSAIPAACTLSDISLSMRKGQVYGICGAVGSGKSSLISAILGQMKIVRGDLSVSGSIAYVSQQAWIMNATVKDNVVFGQPLDERRYQLALDACALQDDLKIFPAGDQTEIGERGINLSGGQKQRVSLARAVYSNRDVYLLDDPLSAVDAHVASHLFEKCISGVLQGKTVVFVTHQLQFLHGCDFIVVMKDGRMLESGTHDQLMSVDSEYRTLIETYHAQEEEAGEVVEQDIGTIRFDRMLSEPGQRVNDKPKDSSTGRPRSLSLGAQSADGTSVDAPAFGRYARGMGGTVQRPKSQVSLVDTALEESQHIDDMCVEAESISSIKAALDAELSAEPNGEALTTSRVAGAKLIKAERVEKGAIAWDTYKYYINAFGGWMFVACLAFVMVLWISTSGVANYWLSYWLRQGSGVQDTNMSLSYNRPGDSDSYADSLSDNPELDYFVTVYGLLAIAVLVALMLKSLLFSKLAVQAAVRLHEQLLQKVLRLPMSYFDVTLTGQIINRFAKDTDEVDLFFPVTLEHFLINSMQILSTLVVISIVMPYMLLLAVPLVAVLIFLNKVIRSGVREIKRLDNVSKSPWFSHVATTVQGLSTLQAYGMESNFLGRFNELIDKTSMPQFLFNSAMRWAATRLEVITITVTMFTTGLIVCLPRGFLEPAYAALALSYAMSMTGLFQYTVRLLIETESRFTSAERIIVDIQKLQTEAPSVILTNRPPAHWPQEGIIVFDGVCLKYREELPLVLKNVSFASRPYEKIGIVGRTGSGKSSLGVALFRLVEVCSGKITLDSVNICNIGLEDLRCKLSIIPQDPVLFSGSVRYNLDPFGMHSDGELWNALEKCHMLNAIMSLERRLEAPVLQGGENFSVGERQLLCMARALLRHSRVLVLDEATAAIDTETDALVQQTIKEVFRDCTLLIIAHRLNTVMLCDRVMVLEEGQLLEFDTPENLLAKDSYFSRLLAVQKSHSPRKAPC